jgi:hypothetical protein
MKTRLYAWWLKALEQYLRDYAVVYVPFLLFGVENVKKVFLIRHRFRVSKRLHWWSFYHCGFWFLQ